MDTVWKFIPKIAGTPTFFLHGGAAGLSGSCTVVSGQAPGGLVVRLSRGGGRAGLGGLHVWAPEQHEAAPAGRWYLTGVDAAAGEVRTFRLDRACTVRTLADTFDVPHTGAPGDLLLDALARAPRRVAVSVLVEATREHIDRRTPRGLAVVEPQAGPWVRLRLQVEELDWVPSLLAWIDRPVRDRGTTRSA